MRQQTGEKFDFEEYYWFRKSDTEAPLGGSLHYNGLIVVSEINGGGSLEERGRKEMLGKKSILFGADKSSAKKGASCGKGRGGCPLGKRSCMGCALSERGTRRKTESRGKGNYLFQWKDSCLKKPGDARRFAKVRERKESQSQEGKSCLSTGSKPGGEKKFERKKLADIVGQEEKEGAGGGGGAVRDERKLNLTQTEVRCPPHDP